jgi:hypothetical protein
MSKNPAKGFSHTRKGASSHQIRQVRDRIPAKEPELPESSLQNKTVLKKLTPIIVPFKALDFL